MGYRDEQEALHWRQRDLEEQLYAIEDELEHHERLEQQAESVRKELHEVLRQLHNAEQPSRRRNYLWAVACGSVALLTCAAGFMFLSFPRYTYSVSDTADVMTRTVRAVAIQNQALHPTSACPTLASLTRDRELQEGQRLDPWGTPFRIQCHDDDITVLSAGPDRYFGSSDDIIAGPPL